MIRFYVVGIEALTRQQERAFIAWAHDAKGLGWWHWISNFWLLVGHQEVTCSDIRDELLRLAPGMDCLVLEVNPVTWAGFGPKTTVHDMFKWIKSTWRSDETS